MHTTLSLHCAAPTRLALTVEETETRGRVILNGGTELHYRLTERGADIADLSPGLPPTVLLGLLAGRFCHHSPTDTVTVSLPGTQAWGIEQVREGLFDTLKVVAPGRLELTCHRQTFWQHPALWLDAPASGHYPLRYAVQDGKRHPLRPPIAPGAVYRRVIPGLGSTFSLRTVDIDTDLMAFNRWMNLEQVAYFWEQAGNAEEHARYLQQMLDDPRVHPLIGCYDDEPFAYFEVYWCKEDRIAPFYDVQDHDRGWHVVIGESKHQGLGKLRGWFRSLMHYMFLDEPRTQRILGEPRIDHTRQIDFLKSQGYAHLKNIQLPHKQAALLRLERESFFDEHRL